MKLPTRTRGYGLMFDITPLIDIVFNLIIFFLMVANFSGREAQLPIDLPRIAEADEHEESPRRLVITITANGQMSVAERPVALFEIEQILVEDAAADPDGYEVQVRGDAGTPYSIIEPLMLLCAKHGVRNVGFKVREEAE
jgi:biopolymer transport protein ExbD